MMHGIRAKKTDWLKNYKLPHVFVNDVWEMCAKTAKYKFTRPILSLMAGLILFGSDRGYNEALDDGGYRKLVLRSNIWAKYIHTQ